MSIYSCDNTTLDMFWMLRNANFRDSVYQSQSETVISKYKGVRKQGNKL